MAQSLSNVLIHLIYSTKNREPFLRSPKLRSELEAYLVGTLDRLECNSLCVGIVADHAHILCRLSRTVAIAKLVRDLKAESSLWVKRHQFGTRFPVAGRVRGIFGERFQRRTRETLHRNSGSASPHQNVSGGLRAFLRRHQVVFDERYVWD
jgi:putative transposase